MSRVYAAASPRLSGEIRPLRLSSRHVRPAPPSSVGRRSRPGERVRRDGELVDLDAVGPGEDRQRPLAARAQGTRRPATRRPSGRRRAAARGRPGARDVSAAVRGVEVPERVTARGEADRRRQHVRSQSRGEAEVPVGGDDGEGGGRGKRRPSLITARPTTISPSPAPSALIDPSARRGTDGRSRSRSASERSGRPSSTIVGRADDRGVAAVGEHRRETGVALLQPGRRRVGADAGDDRPVPRRDADERELSPGGQTSSAAMTPGSCVSRIRPPSDRPPSGAG